MRFNGLDLNLLVAFDALWTERNLSAAARSINLSQPAMSAAVQRLRTFFGDDLFVIFGRELVPTPLAESLAAPTRDALLHIQLSITTRDAFGPTKSDRQFRVVLSDFMTVVFFRRIVERVARELPKSPSNCCSSTICRTSRSGAARSICWSFPRYVHVARSLKGDTV